jgi:hypothetical protein
MHTHVILLQLLMASVFSLASAVVGGLWHAVGPRGRPVPVAVGISRLRIQDIWG